MPKFPSGTGKLDVRFRRSPAVSGSVFALALIAFGLASQAQLPSGDQLQQLQQQLQQRQNQSYGNSEQQTGPASVVLQPAVPDLQSAPRQSRLEQILSSRAGVQLKQFGYDQLGAGRTITVPQTGAVQDDYVLGPGDEIIVSLRGQENGEYRATVDRNGRIVLPRLAPLSGSGRSFGSFRVDLEAAVHRSYVATEASVSIGRVRQISVLVSGEVNVPGERLLTGLSSAVDALLLSGGVRKTGSLRNIRISRGGHEYSVDLYSVLTSAGGTSSLRLADGDRIIVPPLGGTVAVTGLVRGQGIFELPPRSSAITARALMALAGGKEVRGRYRMSLLHILPDGRSELMDLANENSLIRDSEILSVQLSADQTTSQATLSGGSGLAGGYPVTSATRLSAIIKAPGALGLSPYTPFGIIVRKNSATLMPALSAFTPVAVLNGTEDQSLQSGDIIRVLSVNEIQLLTFIVQSYIEALATQQAGIRNPLGRNSGDTAAASLISQSGQYSEIVDVASVPASVQRNVVNNLLDTPVPGSNLARRQIDQQRAARRAQQPFQPNPAIQQQDGHNPTMMAAGPGSQQGAVFGDQQGTGISSQQGAGTSYQPNPDVNQGSLQYSGNAQSFSRDNLNRDIEPARNFSNQATDSDRFATNREVETFGQLARQLGVDPLILMNFLVDCRARIDGAVRGAGYYFVGPNATLNDIVQAAGGTINWADEGSVELISTSIDRKNAHASTTHTTMALREGSLASYVVRPRDQFRFRQTFTDVGVGSVTVQGEVRSAGSFPIIRGEHLSDLLARAGGLTSVAYPYGTVFLRQSAAQREREGYIRAANEVQDQLVVAMTRIGNDKIDPNTFASMQTFVNELRTQKALGRISIVADPSVLAANPALDPLLEPGDVIYIPQRPSTISVLGQVLQPGSYPYRPGESVRDYIARAGGYARIADDSNTFVVLPDGSARRPERSWLSLGAVDSLPPGSSVVVPRDVTPLDMRQTIIDVTTIFSQLAVSLASVAVLSKQ